MSAHHHHPPTAQDIKLSYHPKGYGVSPSLKRARKPFILTNFLIGGSLFAFAVGVYVYSISAVKQDDFSDVEDLLPPLEERKNLRSIEDEQRSVSSLQSLASPLPLAAPRPIPSATSSGSAPAKSLPGQDLGAPTLTAPASLGNVSGAGAGAGQRGWGLGLGLRRLSDVDWLQQRGWVDAKGNVLVWGAPDVERIGRMGDAAGKRVV